MDFGKPTDGVISKYINRRISGIITKALLRVHKNPSPNKITIFTTLFGIFSSFFYILRKPIIAGILIQLASILDGVDGEVARILNRKTKFGGFLDSLLDRLVDISAILCLSYFILTSSLFPADKLFIISFMALSGSILVSFTNARSEASLGVHPKYFSIPPIATRDVRLFLIFLGSVLGFYIEILILISVLSYTYVFIVLIKAYTINKKGLFEQE